MNRNDAAHHGASAYPCIAAEQIPARIGQGLALQRVDAQRHGSGEQFERQGEHHHRVRIRRVATGLPQWPFEEHARSPADVQHRAARALGAPAPVRPRGQRHALDRGRCAQAMGLPIGCSRACCDVLAGQDVAVQIDGQVVGAVHAALLAEG